MKLLIVALFVASACAFEDRDAQIVRSDFKLSPEGGFQWGYENDNKISAQEVGELKNFGESSAVVVRGQNSYVNPDGVTIETTFVADENGYQPQGAHLPTTPAPEPIPEYILRALEFIKAHPYEEKKL